MDVYLQVTDDGGLTWKNLGERSKHIDNHAIWIDPGDTAHYLVGSDGGIYESFDRGRTWKFMTNPPVTQFYKIAVDYAEPGLVERLREVAGSHWRSTAAPTPAQRAGYELVAEEFKPLLGELREIVEIDVKKIEKTLESLGAAATPGRLPEWKKI